VSKRFLFPLLSCAALLASSSLNFAEAAPRGASCVISVGADPCDGGLSCIFTNVGRTTGICCPRWQGPRPAESHRGRVVRWKCADMAFSWWKQEVIGPGPIQKRLQCWLAPCDLGLEAQRVLPWPRILESCCLVWLLSFSRVPQSSAVL